VQFTGAKKIDERELPDHETDDRQEQPAISMLNSDYPTKTVKPEQFCRNHVGVWDQDSTRTIDVQPGCIQPRFAASDLGLEGKLVTLVEEDLVFHNASTAACSTERPARAGFPNTKT
jgi:hypothetical protein